MGVDLRTISVSLLTLCLSFPNGCKINCMLLFTVNKYSYSDFTYPLLFFQQAFLQCREMLWFDCFRKLKVLTLG